MQTQLAQPNRLETMGQLTASVAPEVYQPIAVTVTNAQSALRWLRLDPPDLDRVLRSRQPYRVSSEIAPAFRRTRDRGAKDPATADDKFASQAASSPNADQSRSAHPWATTATTRRSCTRLRQPREVARGRSIDAHGRSQ